MTVVVLVASLLLALADAQISSNLLLADCVQHEKRSECVAPRPHLSDLGTC